MPRIVAPLRQQQLEKIAKTLRLGCPTLAVRYAWHGRKKSQSKREAVPLEAFPGMLAPKSRGLQVFFSEQAGVGKTFNDINYMIRQAGLATIPARIGYLTDDTSCLLADDNDPILSTAYGEMKMDPPPATLFDPQGCLQQVAGSLHHPSFG